MPALPNVPNVFKVTFHFDVGEDIAAQVRQYYKWTGATPDGTILLGLISSAQGTIGAQLEGGMDTDTTFTGLELLDLTSDTGASLRGTGSFVGTRDGDPLGANTAVLQNSVIARRYRGGKPRSYWPLGTSADLDSRGIWSSAAIADFNTILGEIDSDLNGAASGGCTIGARVNLSYYQGFVVVTNITTGRARNVASPRTGTIPVDVITSSTVAQRVASQRRRDLQRR